ncbi:MULTISPECIES: RNA polymerase sigma factor [unclassified Pedobacter]|uniref:RNA polymerase sigma factor n=1 Tax=unclassified Pedobacter TaxID=2628915 RepID=UPI001BE8AB77|nr:MULTISPECIES: RNA polymerase sigma factor [unclassified Pedobacter]MBT2564711.1 RNA polymerase sigma factor [Pedobacter sp. ISL-64]
MIFKKHRNLGDHYLDSALRGERKGLEYLVNAYRDMAYTIAVRIVGNHEDAEEVVQDSFLKAFKYLDRFKRASKFSTWLYRIIYNTALTKIGVKNNVTLELEDDNEYTEYVSDEGSALQRLANADRKKYLGIAIEKLKKEDQLIITLHYIADKSIAEITEIMGMKSSAIKMRLLRSRKQLEGELKRLLKNEIKEL